MTRPTNLPADPTSWSNASSAFNTIIITVIRQINWHLAGLRDDVIHRSHKEDTALLGSVFALVKLADGMRGSDPAHVAKQQVAEWRVVYDEWFKRRRFRSARAREHERTMHALLDRLEARASSYVRSLWITDLPPGVDVGGVSDDQARDDLEDSQQEKPQIQFMTFDDGSHSMYFDTALGGYMWHGIVDYLAKRRCIKGYDRIEFDPESSMFAARAADHGVLERLAEIVDEVAADRTLFDEAVANADPELKD